MQLFIDTEQETEGPFFDVLGYVVDLLEARGLTVSRVQSTQRVPGGLISSSTSFRSVKVGDGDEYILAEAMALHIGDM